MVVLSGLSCIVISAFIPGVGAVGYYLPDSDFYRGYHILIDSDYAETLLALRSGAGLTIKLWQPIAVIAFPSYHACLALLAV